MSLDSKSHHCIWYVTQRGSLFHPEYNMDMSICLHPECIVATQQATDLNNSQQANLMVKHQLTLRAKRRVRLAPPPKSLKWPPCAKGAVCLAVETNQYLPFGSGFHSSELMLNQKCLLWTNKKSGSPFSRKKPFLTIRTKHLKLVKINFHHTSVQSVWDWYGWNCL